jgi:hypothetical protein
MRRLSQAELMKATALDRNVLKQHQHRDQVALAFGRQHCYESLSYVELDAAGVMLADTLTKPYGRDVAAQIVRVHCDQWATAIALFEKEYKAGVFFVADFENAKRQATHLTGASNDQGDALDKIRMLPQAAGHKLLSVNFVDMAPLIRFVQKTGAGHGINLLAPWVPPHGSPEFAELFSSYADARDAAIIKVGAMVKAGEKARAKFEKMAVIGGIN